MDTFDFLIILCYTRRNNWFVTTMRKSCGVNHHLNYFFFFWGGGVFASNSLLLKNYECIYNSIFYRCAQLVPGCTETSYLFNVCKFIEDILNAFILWQYVLRQCNFDPHCKCTAEGQTCLRMNLAFRTLTLSLEHFQDHNLQHFVNIIVRSVFFSCERPH